MLPGYPAPRGAIPWGHPARNSRNFPCGFSRMSDVNLREPLLFQDFRKT